MNIVKKHIQHFNRLSGHKVSKATLQTFYAKVKACNDHALKEVETRLANALVKIGSQPVILQVKPIQFQSTSKNKPDDHLLDGVEQIQDDSELNGKALGQIGDTTYKVITDKILSLINKGGLIWRKPWNEKHQGKDSHAHNYVTKTFYRGTNFYLNYLLLSDFKSPYFLTFKQVDQQGGKVKAGQKGWPVVYFKYLYKKGNILVDEKVATINKVLKPGYTKFPSLFYYTVFNSDQCSGLDLKLPVPVEISTKQQIESCEQIVEGMSKPPEIINGSKNEASYNQQTDKVKMPLIEQFKIDQEYYSVLFHELIHSTGSQTRIDRDLSGKYGSKKYAFEELIAELGASYLCGESGVLYHTLKNSAAYIKSWTQALQAEMKADPKFFLKASAAAEKASKYILGEKKATVNTVSKASYERKPLKRKEAGVPGVSASVSKAINDLVTMKPTRFAKKPMAMQMLYAQFKNGEEEVELKEDSLVQKLLEKEAWIEFEKSTSGDNKIYSITEKGKEILSAVNGRLTSLRVKKQGGELFPNLNGNKKMKSDLDGVVDASAIAKQVFKKIDLDGRYKQDFHKLYSDTQIMINGAPGSGKTVYLLQFAQYLASKINMHVLYLANEEMGRSTFTEKIIEFKIGHKNLKFAKTLPINIASFQVVFFDSVQSLGFSLNGYKKFVDANPGKLFILIAQNTKDGDFRGGNDWEHEVDIAGEIRNRKMILRKNRLDSEFAKKSDKLNMDEAVHEARKRKEIRDKVKTHKVKSNDTNS